MPTAQAHDPDHGPTHDATNAAELLAALAHPLRVLTIQELAHGPRCVHELVDVLGTTQPLVSQHLRVLRSSRLVVTQRRGREVVYSLADEHVAHIVHDALRHAQEPQSTDRSRTTPRSKLVSKGERR